MLYFFKIKSVIWLAFLVIKGVSIKHFCFISFRMFIYFSLTIPTKLPVWLSILWLVYSSLNEVSIILHSILFFILIYNVRSSISFVSYFQVFSFLIKPYFFNFWLSKVPLLNISSSNIIPPKKKINTIF